MRSSGSGPSRGRRRTYVTSWLNGRVGYLTAACTAILVSALLAACATLWEPAQHGVSLEVAGTDAARITHVDVFQKGHGLHLVGEVDIDTQAPMLMKMPGYVEVSVVSAHVGKTTYRPHAYRHIHDHDVTYQRFSFAVDIPGFPPKGSVIHMEYHRGADGQ